ncbi:ATP-dependent DNA helicase RecQ-like [Crassostrea virginica]
MKDQVEKLSRIPNVRAIYRDGIEETDRIIREGALDYLFGALELLVGDSSFREQLHHFSVSTIVVDEFHTIASWGEKDEEDRQAFRKWFSYLGELRSVFPEASLLALSATCTRKISKRVKKVLNCRDNTLEIPMSPDKPNIKVVTKKLANSVDQGMAWMVDALDSIAKTVIYCNSIQDVSKLYVYLTSEVPNSVNYCEMFHSETPKAKKEKMLNDLCNEDGLLKITIATSALGMGIDVPKTNNVILYGVPQQMVKIIQEIDATEIYEEQDEFDAFMSSDFEFE